MNRKTRTDNDPLPPAENRPRIPLSARCPHPYVSGLRHLQQFAGYGVVTVNAREYEIPAKEALYFESDHHPCGYGCFLCLRGNPG